MKKVWKQLSKVKKRWLMVIFSSVWLIANAICAWVSIFKFQFEPSSMITACFVDGVIPIAITGVIGALELFKK